MTTDSIDVLDGENSLEDVFAVRQSVFVDEQGVSEAIEYDGNDADATHLLARAEGEPTGTARLRVLDDTTAKVERVAVRQAWRNCGWGRRLMEAAEAVASERDIDSLVLHAQVAAEEFYQRCGYETTSGEFEEAEIPHVEMIKDI